jgi:radical SAM protein with 4Fe4S-binding SPASM domain
MAPESVDTDRRPLVLVWELTRACGLACDHCRAEADPERHPRELTTAEGKRLLEDARKFGEEQLVVLSGGDPLARDDVAELVACGDDLGLGMTLTPSGTESLTRERVGTLADAGLRRLAVSVDGTRKTHDAFRGEPGSFDAPRRAAAAARDCGLPLQVNTTVCARTVDDLPAVRDLVAELGAVLWSVFFLVPVGRGATLDPVSPVRAESVAEWLHDVACDAPFSVKTTEAPHYRRVAAQTSDGERSGAGRPRVTAGDGFAFVSHVGDVYPSGFLPIAAGNVREESVAEVYRESALFERLRDPEALGGKCSACEYRGLCGGSRSRAYAYTGDPLAADPLCPYAPEDFDGPLPEHPART